MPASGIGMDTTWSKYLILAYVVDHMQTRVRRNIFMHMRNTADCDEDWFFPRHGITAGEFCVFHTLHQSRQRPPTEA